MLSFGDGRRLSFWKGKWCGEATLRASFLSLFVLVISKEATLANVWDASRMAMWVEPPFHLILQMTGNWKIQRTSFLHSKARGVFLGKEGSMFLKEGKGGCLSVKSLYEILDYMCTVLSHTASLGTLVFLQMCGFLLGKLPRVKF